jgi:hypothetical protein
MILNRLEQAPSQMPNALLKPCPAVPEERKKLKVRDPNKYNWRPFHLPHALPNPAPAVPEERKKLKVRDPDKYNWRPRELISQLARIHLHLYRTHPHQWVEVGGMSLGGGGGSRIEGCYL